jgi:glycosyltransferase 2 family protein
VRWDWKAVLGILISALLIWWVLRGVDPEAVWNEVRRANWWLLAAAVAVATSGFLIRALRWKLLLHPLHPRTGLRTRFAAVNIGFAANNLLPARVGEFARAWAISRVEPVTVSGAVGSLVVERFLDAVAISILLGVALLHPSFPADATVGGQPLARVLWILLTALGGVLAFISLLVLFPRTLVAWTGRVTRILPERIGRIVVEVMGSFLSGLGALRDPGLFAGAMAWSLGFWSWNAVSFWLAFHAFGIDQGYATALFVQAIIALGVAIPSAPGFFGTFHAAAVVGLHEVYRVEEGATLAFAFGYHLGGFIPVTLIGLWYAGQLGLSFGELGRAEEAVERELEAAGEGGGAP